MNTLNELPREVREELEVHNPYLNPCDAECGELLDALLRRGYLVQPIDTGLRFDDKPHPEDFEDLANLVGISVINRREAILNSDFIPIYDCLGDRLILVRRGFGVSEVCRKLTSDRQRMHIRGMYWHSKSGHGRTDVGRRLNWEGFIGLRYGCLVPVSALDPGVALLVKVFSWYGVGTEMSCQGHLLCDKRVTLEEAASCQGYVVFGKHKHPYIFFISEDHIKWAKVVLMSTFPRTFGQRGWLEGFTAENRWDGLFWRLSKSHWPLLMIEESHHRQLMEVLYRMARRLMDPERAARFRDRKESLTPGELHLMSHLLDEQDEAAFEEVWNRDSGVARPPRGYRNDPKCG